MTACPDCAHAATELHWPGMRNGCVGCQARHCALYGGTTQRLIELLALRDGGQEALDRLTARTAEEARRITLLRAVRGDFMERV